MKCSTPGLSVHHKLPEFTQTHAHRVGDAIQPSHPLSSPSPPTPNPFQNQGLFQWVNSSHEVAKVLELQLQHHSFQWMSRTDLLQDGLVGPPCSPRDSQEYSPTPWLKSINSSTLSFFYSPTLTNNMVYAEQLLTLSSWESGILVHARQTVFIWPTSNNSLGHSVSSELLWLTTSHKYCHNSLVEELGASYDLYEELGGLQSIGSQRVGHDSSDWACTHDLHDSTGRKLLEACNSFPLSLVWCIFSLCWFYFASFQWNKS